MLPYKIAQVLLKLLFTLDLTTNLFELDQLIIPEHEKIKNKMKAMQTKQNFFPNDCLDLADDRLNLDLTWYKYFVLQSCDQNIHFLVHIHNLTLETLDSRF